jgi:hypothetical protein
MRPVTVKSRYQNETIRLRTSGAETVIRVNLVPRLRPEQP